MLTEDSFVQFVLFPFIPYAISLSLSVNYREMRRSQVPMLRSRARIAFEANCRSLQRLGGIFWSAANMAKTGEMMLREIDRVYFQVVDGSRRKSVADVTVNGKEHALSAFKLPAPSRVRTSRTNDRRNLVSHRVPSRKSPHSTSI
jgi:hypothetical protein